MTALVALAKLVVALHPMAHGSLAWCGVGESVGVKCIARLRFNPQVVPSRGFRSVAPLPRHLHQGPDLFEASSPLPRRRRARTSR